MEKISKILVALLIIFILSATICIVLIKKQNNINNIDSSYQNSNFVEKTNNTNKNKVVDEVSFTKTNYNGSPLWFREGTVKAIDDNSITVDFGKLENFDVDFIKTPVNKFTFSSKGLDVMQEKKGDFQDDIKIEKFNKEGIKNGDFVTVGFNEDMEVGSITQLLKNDIDE